MKRSSKVPRRANADPTPNTIGADKVVGIFNLRFRIKKHLKRQSRIRDRTMFKHSL